MLRIEHNIFIIIASLILTIILMPLRYEVFSSYLNVTLSLIALINILIFWRSSSKINNHWVRFEVLFLIGYLIVHFQIPFTASFGWEPNNPSFIWINKNVVNYATWLSVIALLFWILGYLISYLNLNRKKRYYQSEFKLDLAIILKRLKSILIILFLLFISFVGQEFLRGAYDGGDNWGVGASYIYLLLHSTIIIYIITLLIYNKRKMRSLKSFKSIIIKDKISLVVIGLYLGIFLLAGDRGPVIQISIVALSLFSITQIRIKGITFFSLILFASIFMTIIKMGRIDPLHRTESNILIEGYRGFSESNELNPTLELATTNRILFRALDIVPTSHPYLYGTTMMGDIISGIPFGARMIFPILDIPKHYTSSTYFFTFIGQGTSPTWGEGSEIIADIYINVGIYGVMALMFFFGMLISRLSFSMVYKSNLFTTIVYYIFTMLSIYLNRSTFFTVIQPLVITTIIFIGVSFNAKKKN